MSFWNRLVERFRAGEGEEIDWEALLIEADLGVKLATEWVDDLKDKGLSRTPERAEKLLREKMTGLVRIPPPLPIKQKPEVILLIGVNGSGKTTTAAKLAARAKQESKSVHLGAADTFRAAATEQLEAWGAPCLEIPGDELRPPSTDPAAVAVKSLFAAQEAKADLLIIDTAGRQANKRNLLLELQKIKRSLQKKAESVPHHTWLVADGTTGSGVLAQAKEFHEAVGLTGLIVTKLDGSARGGMVAAVRAEIGLPTYYVGRGEKSEDLKRFGMRRSSSRASSRIDGTRGDSRPTIRGYSLRMSDERFLRRALDLAQLGSGLTFPNPRVGAVLVHGGKIIGEGFHLRVGNARTRKCTPSPMRKSTATASRARRSTSRSSRAPRRDARRPARA